jgi:hypothetical protein
MPSRARTLTLHTPQYPSLVFRFAIRSSSPVLVSSSAVGLSAGEALDRLHESRTGTAAEVAVIKCPIADSHEDAATVHALSHYVLSKLHAVTAQPVVCAVDQPWKRLAKPFDGIAYFLGVNIR